MTEPITVRSRDGLALEGAIDRAESPGATLVLCHPHPQMGGTMNAPLLLAIGSAVAGRGWHVMRFNFRGIGGSEGVSSTGTDELQDAFGALDAARELGLPVAIAGWSFGAAVALRIAGSDDDLRGCVAIGPAIDSKPGITEGVPDDVEPHCPVLVVVGSNDEQVSPSRCREWAAAHGATFEEMPGANHFFWAKYDNLTSLVADWLSDPR